MNGNNNMIGDDKKSKDYSKKKELQQFKQLGKRNQERAEITKDRLYKLVAKLVTNEVRLINEEIYARKPQILITGPSDGTD